MEICINGKKTDIPASLSIADLLTREGISDTFGVAIAVNDTVVPKIQWNEYQIKTNDNLLIIHATQGG